MCLWSIQLFPAGLKHNAVIPALNEDYGFFLVEGHLQPLSITNGFEVAKTSQCLVSVLLGLIRSIYRIPEKNTTDDLLLILSAMLLKLSDIVLIMFLKVKSLLFSPSVFSLLFTPLPNKLGHGAAVTVWS